VSSTKLNATFQISGTIPNQGLNVGNPVIGGNAGGVLFVDAFGDLAQSPSTFLWNATNTQLGVGTALPAATIHAASATNTQIIIENTGGTTPQRVQFRSSGVPVAYFGSTLATQSVGGYTGPTGFVWQDSNANELMRLAVVAGTPGGTYSALGIGTPYPKNRLDVAGGTVIGASYTGATGLNAPILAPVNGLVVQGPTGINTTVPGAWLDVTGNVTTNGLTVRSANTVQFNNSGNTQFVAFRAGVLSTSTTWTWPLADGSPGTFLKTDGVGNLSFVVGGGSGGGGASIGATVSGGIAKSVLFVDGSGNLAQDNTLFNYDNIAKKLGFGVTSPSARVHSLVGLTGNMEAVLVNQTDTTNNPNAVRITNTGTGMGLAVYQAGNTPVSDVSAGGVYVDGTSNTGVSVNIYANQPSPSVGASLLRVHSANTAYNQPTVYVRADGTNTGTPTIRFDAYSPLLYLNETAQMFPAGVYSLDGKNDFFRINGMNAAGTAFVPVVVVQRVDSGGVGQGATVGINTGVNTGNSTLQVNGSLATGTTSVATPYTASKNDQYIRVDASANPNGLTISLPIVAGIAGRIYHIAKIDNTTNFVGIAPSGTDTILRQSGYQLFGHEQSIAISSNGVSNWQPYGNIPYALSYLGNGVDSGYNGSVGVSNTAWAVAVTVTQSVIITGMALKVVTASGNIDVGVYDRNGVRITSSGSIACPTGKTIINFNNAAVLTTPGVYYLVVSADNATAAFSTSGADSIVGVNSFPNSFPLPVALQLPGIVGSLAFSLAGLVNGGVGQ